MEFNGTVIVLAGGLGTRLRSVVSELPKCLAPIAGRPFLEWQLRNLEKAGFVRAIIASGYLGEVVERFIADWNARGTRLKAEAVRETELMGTGGALRNAWNACSTLDSVFVVNGDSYVEFDPWHFMGQTGRGVVLGLIQMPDASRYGAVQREGDLIVGFREKAPVPAPGWVNAGVYWLAASRISAIPIGRACSLEREIFPACAQAGQMAGVPLEGMFIDIGLPETFLQAQSLFSELA